MLARVCIVWWVELGALGSLQRTAVVCVALHVRSARAYSALNRAVGSQRFAHGASAGVGTNHAWVVTVSGQNSSASLARTWYAMPEVMGVQWTSLPTTGGPLVTLTGR